MFLAESSLELVAVDFWHDPYDLGEVIPTDNGLCNFSYMARVYELGLVLHSKGSFAPTNRTTTISPLPEHESDIGSISIEMRDMLIFKQVMTHMSKLPPRSLTSVLGVRGSHDQVSSLPP